MTPKQINRTIAKACGWNGYIVLDYFHSLDSCAEFEATIPEAGLQLHDYCVSLLEVTTRDKMAGDKRCHTYLATAPQRCEAFLRVKGLWK